MDAKTFATLYTDSEIPIAVIAKALGTGPRGVYAKGYRLGLRRERGAAPIKHPFRRLPGANAAFISAWESSGRSAARMARIYEVRKDTVQRRVNRLRDKGLIR